MILQVIDLDQADRFAAKGDIAWFIRPGYTWQPAHNVSYEIPHSIEILVQHDEQRCIIFLHRFNAYRVGGRFELHYMALDDLWQRPDILEAVQHCWDVLDAMPQHTKVVK